MPGEQGVDRPHHRRQQGQQVPPGVQLEHGAAVVGQQRHPGQGHRQPGEEGGAQPLPPQQEVGEQGGEHRAHRHQHPHVGGQGVGQGDVLQQIVEGDAAQPRPGEPELLPPLRQAEAAGAPQAQGRKAQHKAEEEDLHRREVLQQHLGGNKGGAPDEDGHQGGGVSRPALFADSHGLCFLSSASIKGARRHAGPGNCLRLTAGARRPAPPGPGPGRPGWAGAGGRGPRTGRSPRSASPWPRP